MKNRIIDALAYARYFVRKDIELDLCPHNGLFAAPDPRCRHCQFAAECAWLYDNEEFVALQTRSLEALVLSLDDAVKYVHASCLQWDHPTEECPCESCSWIRDATGVFDEACRSGELRL